MRMLYEFEVEANATSPRVVEAGGYVFLEIKCNDEERLRVRLTSKRQAAELAALLSAVAPATSPSPRPKDQSVLIEPRPEVKKELKPGQVSMESVVMDALRGKDKVSFSDLQNAIVKAGYAKGSVGMALQKLKIQDKVEQVSYGVYRAKVSEPA